MYTFKSWRIIYIEHQALYIYSIYRTQSNLDTDPTYVWMWSLKPEEQPQSTASLILHVYCAPRFRILFYFYNILTAF
jgi:hypothetical protein